MNTPPTDTPEWLRFRERYRSLPDDDLARLALYEELIPAARAAITEELEARGLRDLSLFRKQFEEDAVLAKAEGLSAFTPVKARLPVRMELARNQRLLGFTVLAAWGLVGVHWWLLGDKTTWDKEATIAMCLFAALMLTWDPLASFVKGQVYGKILVQLVLVWWVFGALVAIGAVPGVGRFVTDSNGPMVLAIIVSPVFVLTLYRAVTRFVSRNRERPD